MKIAKFFGSIFKRTVQLDSKVRHDLFFTCRFWGGGSDWFPRDYFSGLRVIETHNRFGLSRKQPTYPILTEYCCHGFRRNAISY